MLKTMLQPVRMQSHLNSLHSSVYFDSKNWNLGILKPLVHRQLKEEIVLQNHRVVDVGKDLRSAGCPGPCPSGFEYLQGWRLYSLSVHSPVPLPDHTQSEKMFPVVQREPQVSVCAQYLWSCHWAALKPDWLCSLCTFLWDIYIPEPSFFQAEQCLHCQPFQSLGQYSDIQVNICGPLPGCLQCVHVSCTRQPRTGPSTPGVASPGAASCLWCSFCWTDTDNHAHRFLHC